VRNAPRRNRLGLGGAGNDRLIGGVGIDALKGGADSDTFVLDRRTAFRDLISDFNPADDVLDVPAADSGGGLVPGALPAGRFVANTTGLAGDPNDRFIYNTLSGDLIYDNDGSAAGGDRLIATFTNLVPLSASDFIIV